MAKIYNFVVADAEGEKVELKKYEGRVLLIVNTATGCGFTPQYKGLQDLYDKYKDRGLEILDFPCNQFGHQAPGTDAEIGEFCTTKYHTTFPRFRKVEVIGEEAEPLFSYLCEQIPEEEIEGMKNKIAMKAIEKMSKAAGPGHIKWNFTKFLVDKKGKVVGRFAPTEEPEAIAKQIEALL